MSSVHCCVEELCTAIVQIKFSGTTIAPEFRTRADLNSYNIIFKTFDTFPPGQRGMGWAPAQDDFR